MYTFKEYCYELYKEDWKIQHGITREKEKDYIKDYLAGIMEYEEFNNYSYKDYLEEFGYNGECYSSYEEFVNNEYLDIDYMTQLFEIEDNFSEEILMSHYKHDKNNL